jgi:hypothetical protein
MDAFQPSELINFLASMIFLVVLLSLSRSKNWIIQKIFVIGIFLTLTGNFCTVIESFIFPKVFNIIEHFSFSLGTICFFIGTIRISKGYA